MKRATKRTLKRILRFVPTPNWTARYPDLNRLERCKVNALSRILLKKTNQMVFAGPFATMKLTDNIELWEDPRIIAGSYEEEVHGVINDVICRAPQDVIVIGAAFGYYAVGFALKIAGATVTAFEAVEDPCWNELAELARINGVGDRIVQRGLCTAEELEKVCRPNSFVICDCEGAEEDILLPCKVRALESCTMLVELHECYRPRLMPTLVERFHKSHKITMIEEGDRNPARYRILKELPRAWQSIAVEENRWMPGKSSQIPVALRFMVCEPKAAPAHEQYGR